MISYHIGTASTVCSIFPRQDCYCGREGVIAQRSACDGTVFLPRMVHLSTGKTCASSDTCGGVPSWVALGAGRCMQTEVSPKFINGPGPDTRYLLLEFYSTLFPVATFFMGISSGAPHETITT